jgi:UTP--glucose-1-phosphate uridylyltransferase
MKRVRKAVLPVAGLGTRVLPISKSVPKNLLNVVDRPILSYVLAEGRAAGIEHFVLITGRGQESIEHYFDRQPEIEDSLAAKGKKELLDELMAEVPAAGEISFVRQGAPLGLGHAVACARHIIGDEPFAVMLPDMLMAAKPPALAQAVAAYEQKGGNIVVVEPAPGTEPSNLFISRRYILHPEIFGLLESQERGAGGEIQLTDAMLRLLAQQDFHALEYDGVTYDCGDKVGLLRANVAFAMQRPDLKDAVRSALLPLLG